MGVVYSEEEREADQGASAAPGGNAAATTTTFPAALPLPALAAPAGRKTLVLDLVSGQLACAYVCVCVRVGFDTTLRTPACWPARAQAMCLLPSAA